MPRLPANRPIAVRLPKWLNTEPWGVTGELICSLLEITKTEMQVLKGSVRIPNPEIMIKAEERLYWSASEQLRSAHRMTWAQDLAEQAKRFMSGLNQREDTLKDLSGFLRAVGGGLMQTTHPGETLVPILHRLPLVVSDPEHVHIVVPGKPHSKMRPRAGGRRVYQPKDDADAEKKTSNYMREVVGEVIPFTGNVSLLCVFYVPDRTHRDLDNMLKHVGDAANGILWHDDSQVTSMFAHAEYDKENPRMEIWLAAGESSLKRGSDAVHSCPGCGREVAYDKPYCTKRCRTLHASGVTPLLPRT